jgi:hypothetical protein
MRFLYFTIFILTCSSVVYFNDVFLPGFFSGGENSSVVKKVSVVKPKSIVNKSEALGPVSHQFTFFETLEDKTMTKYVGLHGEMLPVSLPERPVALSHSKIVETAQLKPKEKVKAIEGKQLPMLPRFAVQVSSFRDVKMASALKMKLQKKGFDAYLMEIELPNDGGKWHRVFLGQYVDEALARKAAERARQEYKLNAAVIKKTG